MLELHEELMSVVKSLGLPTDFTLLLKKYNRTQFGNYNPNYKRVILYVYTCEKLKHKYSFNELAKILIHEVIHHIQYSNPKHVRIKGVMHDVEFKTLLNTYTIKLEELLKEKEKYKCL